MEKVEREYKIIKRKKLAKLKSDFDKLMEASAEYRA